MASAAARVLVAHDASHRPVAVVGRDPRASGEMLEAAVVAGLAAAGADVLRVGVLPTPAVAFLTGVLRRRPRRRALRVAQPDARQRHQAVRRAAASSCPTTSRPRSRPRSSARAGAPDRRGRRPGARAADDAVERYLEHLLAAVPVRLDGLHVVVDCAHGAASVLAPEMYRRAGARVTAIAAEPDGLNINDGVGSTHLD